MMKPIGIKNSPSAVVLSEVKPQENLTAKPDSQSQQTDIEGHITPTPFLGRQQSVLFSKFLTLVLGASLLGMGFSPQAQAGSALNNGLKAAKAAGTVVRVPVVHGAKTAATIADELAASLSKAQAATAQARAQAGQAQNAARQADAALVQKQNQLNTMTQQGAPPQAIQQVQGELNAARQHQTQAAQIFGETDAAAQTAMANEATVFQQYQRAVEQVQIEKQAIQVRPVDVNPQYKVDPNNFSRNCIGCDEATRATLQGNPAQATQNALQNSQGWINTLVAEQKAIPVGGYAGIIDRANALPPNSTFSVAGIWNKGNFGHVFTGVKDANGVVSFMDQGKKLFPDQLGQMLNEMMYIHYIPR